MLSILQIGGDPARWAIDVAMADVVTEALISRHGPIAVDVTAPLIGRLVLSPRSVSSVAVLTLRDAGYIPGGAEWPSALLYVPSPAGPTKDSHGYTLPGPADLAALEQEIVAAMTRHTTIQIPVTDQSWTGPLLLNGSTLPFAVLCPPAEQ
jgi:hypothetical protein